MKRKTFDSFNFMVFLFLFAGSIACKKEETKAVDLLVSPLTIDFEAAGGEEEIHIVCNSQWTINNTSDWCTESVNTSYGDGSFILTAEANEDNESRFATIQVIAAEITREVEITQKGLDDTIPEITYDIPPDNTNMRSISCIELAKEMQIGWNIGNSLDAIGGETAWGNPMISQRLIDSVKAAGFNAIRIPVAWSKFSDEYAFTIETSWMNRVEEVVNYVLGRGLYAIINIHWDEGWIQPTYAQEDYINNRLEVMWKQIATHFRDYNDYLLFAGTNEVMVNGDYGTPTEEYYTVQNGYNQTFVTTVRSTGGRNVYRHLVVQGFNTNIDHAVNFAEMPTDVVSDRLMMEVHYYDPYNFTINENSDITQWGMYATDPLHTETWANEEYADAQFQKMKTGFIDQGIAVILGEYGVLSRLDLGEEGNTEYAWFRKYYIEYITQSMIEHDLIPFYWDNGYTGNHGMGIFDRSTGAMVYPDIVNAIVSSTK
ncbi:MAG: cellulase family glycosylhydrolase [Bacteroidales bacterium]|nr:cellulase family glycosylhydrolase [Bacteroidales bacterium]